MTRQYHWPGTAWLLHRDALIKVRNTESALTRETGAASNVGKAAKKEVVGKWIFVTICTLVIQ